jgi:hypothetical protein
MILKVITARRLMQNIERCGSLANEQWGGRSGRSAIALATFKIVTNDTQLLLRLDGCVFESDLAQCFDRMVGPCSNLALRRHGLPPSITDLWSQTRQAQRHYVKTTHGISSQYHANSPTTPNHGTGQGAGDSPTRWNVVADAIMSAYHRDARSGAFSNPTNTVSLVRRTSAFFDDATLFTNFPQPTDTTTLGSCLTHNAQRWESLVHVTGGKLNLDKCFFVVYKWDFDAEGRAYLIDPPG